MNSPASPQVVHLWCFHPSPGHHQSLFLKAETPESALISSSIEPTTASKMPSPKSLEPTKHIFICSSNMAARIHYHLCISLLTGLPASTLFMFTNASSSQEPEVFFKYKKHIMLHLCLKIVQTLPTVLEENLNSPLWPGALPGPGICQCLHPQLMPSLPQ